IGMPFGHVFQTDVLLAFAFQVHGIRGPRLSWYEALLYEPLGYQFRLAVFGNFIRLYPCTDGPESGVRLPTRGPPEPDYGRTALSGLDGPGQVKEKGKEFGGDFLLGGG